MNPPALVSIFAVLFFIMVGVFLTTDAHNVIQISDCKAPVQVSSGGMNVRCSVTNNSDTPVSAFKARAIFAEPDRPVSWGEKRFGLKVAGGIMPGETVDLDLPHPNVAGLPYGEESTLSFVETEGLSDRGYSILWSRDP
jgi:hypothetical protein